jgi:hypothetical protein
MSVDTYAQSAGVHAFRVVFVFFRALKIAVNNTSKHGHKPSRKVPAGSQPVCSVNFWLMQTSDHVRELI